MSQPNQGVWQPPAASGRLSHTAGATEAGLFSSDLSVSEYGTCCSARPGSSRSGS